MKRIRMQSEVKIWNWTLIMWVKKINKNLVEDYDELTALAMLVPRAGHTRKNEIGILTTSKINKKTGLPFANARDVVARDIKELRRVYPDVPKDKLRQLIELNKAMYPEMRK